MKREGQREPVLWRLARDVGNARNDDKSDAERSRKLRWLGVCLLALGVGLAIASFFVGPAIGGASISAVLVYIAMTMVAIGTAITARNATDATFRRIAEVIDRGDLAMSWVVVVIAAVPAILSGLYSVRLILEPDASPERNGVLAGTWALLVIGYGLRMMVATRPHQLVSTYRRRFRGRYARSVLAADYLLWTAGVLAVAASVDSALNVGAAIVAPTGAVLLAILGVHVTLWLDLSKARVVWLEAASRAADAARRVATTQSEANVAVLVERLAALRDTCAPRLYGRWQMADVSLRAAIEFLYARHSGAGTTMLDIKTLAAYEKEFSAVLDAESGRADVADFLLVLRSRIAGDRYQFPVSLTPQWASGHAPAENDDSCEEAPSASPPRLRTGWVVASLRTNLIQRLRLRRLPRER